MPVRTRDFQLVQVTGGRLALVPSVCLGMCVWHMWVGAVCQL